jgi:hypothetical protein
VAKEIAEFDLTLNDKQFTSSMSKARASTQGLTTSVNKAGSSIGAAATSVSGMNTALGGSVGATNNLIGAAGNLATTFAAAGPVGLAIAAATTGIGLLIDHWAKAGEAAEKAAEDSKRAAKKMAQDLLRLDVQLSALNAGISTSLVGATDDANKLFKELEEVEQKLFEAGFGGLKASLPATFTGKDPLSVKLKGYSEEFIRLKKEAEAATKVVTKMIEIEGFSTDDGLGGDTGAPAGRPKRGRRGAAKASAAASLGLPDIRQGDRFIVGREEFGARLEQLMLEEAEREFEILLNADEQKREILTSSLDDELETQLAITDIHRQQAQERASIAMGFASVAAGVAETVAIGLISGQEGMLEAALNMIAQQVGGFVIGEGVKLAGVAAGKAGALDFGGAAIAGAGSVALIAAGIGIKAGGFVAMQNGLTLPGVGGGSAAPAIEAGRSSGAGGGGAPSSGGGGGLTVHVNYGVGGMNREDVARAVTEAVREGERAGF